MFIERMKLSEDLFTKILDIKKAFIVEIDDIKDYCRPGVDLDKKKVYYDRNNNVFLIKKGHIATIGNMPYPDDYYKMVRCVCDSSLSSDNIRETPYAGTCRKYMKKILLKYYTEEEYEQCLDTHIVSEHVKPLHTPLPYFYKENRVYKLDNCVYYDINNAHLDALTEIFPKAAKALIHLRERIVKLKAQKKYAEAQKLKDIINIYVGDLGNNENPRYKKTNEWIINRTRHKLEALIEEIGGVVLYANTDGAIIRCPDKKITTSNKLGDFKEELIDGIVYLIRHTGKTSYTIYQYAKSNNETIESELKGNALRCVRDKIDLSQGIYVDYDRVKINGGYTAANIEIIKGEVYEARS